MAPNMTAVFLPPSTAPGLQPLGSEGFLWLEDGLYPGSPDCLLLRHRCKTVFLLRLCLLPMFDGFMKSLPYLNAQTQEWSKLADIWAI